MHSSFPFPLDLLPESVAPLFRALPDSLDAHTQIFLVKQLIEAGSATAKFATTQGKTFAKLTYLKDGEDVMVKSFCADVANSFFWNETSLPFTLRFPLWIDGDFFLEHIGPATSLSAHDHMILETILCQNSPSKAQV